MNSSLNSWFSLKNWAISGKGNDDYVYSNMHIDHTTNKINEVWNMRMNDIPGDILSS